MSVSVTFSCSGCFANVEGTAPLRSEFRGITGKPYGFGARHEQRASAVAPEGWVAFDPYTGCCYCPECWASILDGTCDDPAPAASNGGQQ